VDAFLGDELKLLQALAGHIAIAIVNARLFARERLERERMQQESADARTLQQALFLKPVPLIPGIAFETAWHPAGSVAGDWFDFIDLGGQRYGIALADVSGKGMSAALLMSATRAILRSLAPLYSSPAQTLEKLNQVLTEDLPTGKFVTMGLRSARRRVTPTHAGQRRTPSSPALQSPLLISRIRYRPAAWPRDVVVPTVHHHTQRRHPAAALHRWHHGSCEQQRRRIWPGSPYQTLSATRSLCQRPYCGSPALRRGIRSNRRRNSGPHPQPLSTTERS
jgi:Stage II sporulation protein E (SpoIIE)